MAQNHAALPVKLRPNKLKTGTLPGIEPVTDKVWKLSVKPIAGYKLVLLRGVEPRLLD